MDKVYRECEDWKRGTMEHAPEMVKEFISKVIIAIDRYVLEGAA